MGRDRLRDVTAPACDTGPNGGLAETGDSHRGINGSVLDSVDFAEQQRNVSVISNGCRRACRRIGGRGNGGRVGYHQHAIQSHRPLDRRVRA